LCEVCYGLPAQRKHRVAVLRATEKMLPGLPDWRCRRSTYKRGNMLVFYNAASVPSTARADAKRVHSWWGHKWDEPARLAEAERAVAEHAIMQHAGDEERQQLTERRRAEWQLEGAKLSYAVAVARNPVGVLVGASRMASDTLSELAEKARALMVENDPDAIRACLAQIAEALDVIARETRDPMATVQERLAA
jgi:hypothetical protein